ncbi:unnamed protein product [Rotaria socialis]|uniref:Uncharacterized protein n=2 Tax=Rotaria socialis TaxID=392032 RepID=A0A817PQY6_9BILA|nr:unnamed protein product [Rotaria socialis]
MDSSWIPPTLVYMQQQLIRYVCSACLIFGIPGCLLNVILLSQRQVRVTSCCNLMREFERIKRIIDLAAQLWTYDHTLTLGALLQKWIWTDWIESRGDIFHPEDTQTEQRFNEAINKAQLLSTSPSELTELQQDIIQKIEELWHLVPDQRFGQFLSNYAFGHFMSHPPKMMLQQNGQTILEAMQECHKA